MRDFTGSDGRTWSAYAVEERGADYKGRLHMVMRPADDPDAAPLALHDIRWNSERTARRTIETMSEVELRRRLRIALGRKATPTA